MAKKKKRITDEEMTATSADFTDSNFMLMDGGEGSKKVPMDLFADQGHEYTAGNGIDITNDEISVDTDVVATKTDLETKQDTLTMGTGIDITNNVISVDTTVVATKTDLESKQDTMSAGNGIDITNDEISIDTTVVATKTDLESKQDTMSAGNGIDITNDEISIDTTVVATKTDLETKQDTLTAGEAIDITDDTVSVKHGDGLEIDENGNLSVAVGEGLMIVNKVITYNGDVAEIVSEVKKMEEDLDTQLITTFPIPSITKLTDYGDKLSALVQPMNGATFYCAFTIPINNSIRISGGEKSPTLLGVYAKQAHGDQFILGLYEYNFDTGKSDYVADTGAITISQGGKNEFPLKHINPLVEELRSDRVYYATIHLKPQHSASGPVLLSAPGITNQQDQTDINLIPQFACWSQDDGNHPIIDFTDPDVGLNVHDSGTGYKYGPWTNSYTKCYQIPTFFMSIRNSAPTPIVTTPFIDLGTYTLKNNVSAQTIFGVSDNKMVMQEVKPYQNVTITKWTVYDTNATDSDKFSARVYETGWTAIRDSSNVTVTDLGEVLSGTGIYGHECVPATPIPLTANQAYLFTAATASNWGNVGNLVQYDSPTVAKVLYSLQNPGYVASSTVTRMDDVQGTFMMLEDSDGNTWVI